MKISIVINSYRDFNSFGLRVIDSILSAPTNLNYEILIGHNAPIFIPNSRVKAFVYKDETSVEVLNRACHFVTGDIISFLNDASLVSKNYFTGIENAYYAMLKNGGVICTSISTNPSCVGDGLPTGHRAPTEDLSKFPSLEGNIGKFPLILTKNLHHYLGGKIFNPYFKHHWVDNWLGIFCSLLGKPIFEYYDPSFYLSTIEGNRVRNTTHDDFDYKILLGLLKEFNPENPNYLHKPT